MVERAQASVRVGRVRVHVCVRGARRPGTVKAGYKKSLNSNAQDTQWKQYIRGCKVGVL